MAFSLTSVLALQAFGGALGARPQYEHSDFPLHKMATEPALFREVLKLRMLVARRQSAESDEMTSLGVAAAAPEPALAAEDVEADEMTSAAVAAVAPEPALAAEEVAELAPEQEIPVSAFEETFAEDATGTMEVAETKVALSAEEIEEPAPKHDLPISAFEETFAEDTKAGTEAVETEVAAWSDRGELPQVLSEVSESWKKLPTEQLSSKASLVRHSFATASAATGLPVWGVRAAAWPVFMHPGVAASVLALDMALSYANLTDVAVSYIELPSSPVSWAQQAPADAGNVSEGLGSIALFIIVSSALLILNFGLTLCVGCFHQRLVTARRPEFPDPVQDEVSMAEEPHDFHNDAIRCCGPSTCLYAMLVPGVRHADTLTATGVFGYWTTVWIFIVVQVVCGAIFAIVQDANGWFRLWVDLDAALLRGLVLAFVFVPRRRALRDKFESPAEGSWVKDYALWILCSWCAVAQEGLEVDAAEGVAILCPCRLTDAKTGQLVGVPVAEAADGED